MLITKRTYKKKYVIGEAGIFSCIGNFWREYFRVMQQSNERRQFLSQEKLQQKISK